MAVLVTCSIVHIIPVSIYHQKVETERKNSMKRANELRRRLQECDFEMERPIREGPLITVCWTTPTLKGGHVCTPAPVWRIGKVTPRAF